MGGPVSDKYPKWTFENRVWQDKAWGSDVTSFAWGQDGNQIYVGTSMIYGDGGLFAIDLPTRTARRMFPAGKFEMGFAYVIEIFEMDHRSSTLKFLVTKYPNAGGGSISEIQQLNVNH